MDIAWTFEDYASGGKVLCRFGRYEAWQEQSGACAVETPAADDEEALAFAAELLYRHKTTGKIWVGEPELRPAKCHCGREM